MNFRLKFDEEKQKELLLGLKEALGFSQEELAARLDVSRRCLRNWISETRKLPKNVFSKAVSWRPDFKRSLQAEPQPTVDFLLETDVRTRVYSIRLAMSADGGVTARKLINGRMIASLIFGCANPTLLSGWKKVFRSLGIEMGVIKAKVKWAGVGGLVASKKEMLYRFWKLGGFVDGVKITRKSPNFAGVEKNALLNRFLKAGT